MATSGNINSGGYQGRCLQFNWSTQSTSPDNNTRIINYSIIAIGGSSSYYYHHNNTVSINGTNVYTGGASESIKTGDVLKTGTFTINQSSTMKLIVEMHGGIYNYGDNISISKTWDLDEIPRYATLTSLSIKSKSCNSVTISYKSDKSCKIFCSIDGGNTWLNQGLPFKENTTSGEFTVYYKDRSSTIRLDVNKSYTFKVLCRSTASGLDTSKDIATTTYDIAKLIAVPNINIGSSHTITWNNPSGASTSLKLCKTDNSQIINYGTVSGTSKDITPTASTIYVLTPNSNTYKARYILATTVNGQSYTNYKDFIFTVTNSNPTFSNFTYQDTNTAITILTGNNQILVKGYSNPKITVSTGNKATAKNSATMENYKVVSGSKSTTVNYSSSADVTMQLNAIDNATMTVYATDSRGNSTPVSKTATYKDYSQLAIKSVKVTRANNGVGQAVTLTYEGTFWNSSFGNVNNGITSVTYAYKTTSSSSWSSETALTPTVSGNKFSGSLSIKGDLGTEGFNASNSYDIRLTVKDKLITKTYTSILGSGTPAISIYKDRIAIGQIYDANLEKRLQINGEVYAHSNVTSKDMMYYAQRDDTNVRVGFGVGAGGENHGVYSSKHNKWLLYSNNSGDVFVNGHKINSSATRGVKGANTVSNLGWGTNNTYIPDLSMIAYWNGAYSGTASNLKYCSQGEIQSKPKILYDGAGTTGTVTLNETSANFGYLEIYAFNTDNTNYQYPIAKIINPNGKEFAIGSVQNGSSGQIYTTAKGYKISGTSITVNHSQQVGTLTNSATTITNYDNTQIRRVIGYKI